MHNNSHSLGTPGTVGEVNAVDVSECRQGRPRGGPSGSLDAYQLTARLPQLGLQLGVVGGLGRLPFLAVVQVTAAHPLHLGSRCGIDGNGRSLRWSLRE